MIEMTLAEIASATGGELVRLGDATPETRISGLVDTDSRELTEGSIFVCKRGEADDGHRYAPEAIERGARLLIVDHELDAPVPQVVVADTVVALGALAKRVVDEVRARGELVVVGITGSNGKTTTKNLVAEILRGEGETVAAKASFNNEVGAPLTMLKVTRDTRYLVAEMGASAPGEITRLIRMARPDIGVVLKVGLAHAGEFGGIEITQRSKTEMVQGLTGDGVAVLNLDDPRVAAMAEATSARVLWFGRGGGAQVRAEDLASSIDGTAFTLCLPNGESARVRFGVLGEHHVMNALAAAAVCHELGVPLSRIVAGLERIERAEAGRMEVVSRERGVVVINDAYNASPDSMAAALRTLAQIADGRRTVAVLGAMSELGEVAGEEHDAVGLLAVRLNISRIIVVGREARRLHLAAIAQGSWDGESVFVEDADAAFELLERETEQGDIILVKASNSTGLHRLGARLGERFA